MFKSVLKTQKNAENDKKAKKRQTVLRKSHRNSEPEKSCGAGKFAEKKKI